MKVTKGPQVVSVSSIAAPVEIPNCIGDAVEFGMPLMDRTDQIKRKLMVLSV